MCPSSLSLKYSRPLRDPLSCRPRPHLLAVTRRHIPPTRMGDLAMTVIYRDRFGIEVSVELPDGQCLAPSNQIVMLVRGKDGYTERGFYLASHSRVELP